MHAPLTSKLLIAFFVFALAVLMVSPRAKAEILTVPYVDLSKYAGDWYQISDIPQFYEIGTCACTRQRLTARNDGALDVYNSCNRKTPRGKVKDIKGIAYNQDPTTNAKFLIDFNKPWKGTYWVIGLDADYRFAVVSNETGSALYILSKTPTLDAVLYNRAVAIAEAQQISVSKLKMTEQEDCQYPN